MEWANDFYPSKTKKEESNKMGKVLRVTFINVKGNAETKILELAKEICCQQEHNVIIEELTAFVVAVPQEV